MKTSKKRNSTVLRFRLLFQLCTSFFNYRMVRGNWLLWAFQIRSKLWSTSNGQWKLSGMLLWMISGGQDEPLKIETLKSALPQFFNPFGRVSREQVIYKEHFKTALSPPVCEPGTLRILAKKRWVAIFIYKQSFLTQTIRGTMSGRQQEVPQLMSGLKGGRTLFLNCRVLG